jgi:hypothetical protein
MTWLARYWAGDLGSRNPVLLARAAHWDRERVAVLARLTGQTQAAVLAAVAEIEADSAFLRGIRAGLASGSNYAPRPADFRLFDKWGSVFFFPVALYALVRLLRPAIVVETGGTPGKSSAFILRAMARNDHGQLVTIDLPPASVLAPAALPSGQVHQHLPAGRGSGWIVPEELKRRQSLRLGPSASLLGPALDEFGGADFFLHDSDHSYANMLWEFETAWPRLRSGGLLFSDDVISNAAFDDFCRKFGVPGVRLMNVGLARKP